MTPIVVLMIGRLDDWMKVVIERDGLAVDPAAPNWAGIAVFKRTYDIFRERGYRSRLLAAAYRHPLHWTELVGGDVAMTITPSWQARFDASDIRPEAPDAPAGGPAILAELTSEDPGLRAVPTSRMGFSRPSSTLTGRRCERFGRSSVRTTTCRRPCGTSCSPTQTTHRPDGRAARVQPVRPAPVPHAASSVSSSAAASTSMVAAIGRNAQMSTS